MLINAVEMIRGTRRCIGILYNLQEHRDPCLLSCSPINAKKILIYYIKVLSAEQTTIGICKKRNEDIL
jgi:hypothetical protein